MSAIALVSQGDRLVVTGTKVYPNKQRLKAAGATFDVEAKAWVFQTNQTDVAHAIVNEIYLYYHAAASVATATSAAAAAPSPAGVSKTTKKRVREIVEEPIAAAATNETAASASAASAIASVASSSSALPPPKKKHHVNAVTKEQIFAALRDCLLLQSSSAVAAVAAATMFPSTAEDPNVYLDVQVVRFDKTFGLLGKDLFYLRDIIPKCFNPRGHDQKPTFNYVQGYMYHIDDTNETRLHQFMHAVYQTRRPFEERACTVIPSVAPLNRETGIIDWDVPFEAPDWYQRYLPASSTSYDARLNPILNANGTVHFQKAAFSMATIGAVFRDLLKTDDKDDGNNRTFPGLWKQPPIQTQEQLRAFILCDNHAEIVTVATWSLHARYLVRCTHTLFVYDPWRQSASGKAAFVKEAKAMLPALGWSWCFKSHCVDQGSEEGSCVPASVSRALMIAHLGHTEAATQGPLLPAYALLTSRLVSKFRSVRA